MIFSSPCRAIGPSDGPDDRGSVGDSGSLCGVHGVRLVLSHAPSTQTEDGKGTGCYSPH